MTAPISNVEIDLRRRGRVWDSYQDEVQDDGLVNLDELGHSS
jgi:hypothetical protein